MTDRALLAILAALIHTSASDKYSPAQAVRAAQELLAATDAALAAPAPPATHAAAAPIPEQTDAEQPRPKATTRK
jgi:hypothetical protein